MMLISRSVFVFLLWITTSDCTSIYSGTRYEYQQDNDTAMINLSIANYLKPNTGIDYVYLESNTSLIKFYNILPSTISERRVIKGGLYWNVSVMLESGRKLIKNEVFIPFNSLLYVYGDKEHPQIENQLALFPLTINDATLDSRFGMSYSNSFDFALVTLYSTLQYAVVVHGNSAACSNCKEEMIAELEYEQFIKVLIDTNFPYSIAVYNASHLQILCNETFHFIQNGSYNLVLNQTNGKITLDMHPTDDVHDGFYIPIIIAAVIFAALAILWQIIYYIYKNYSLDGQWRLRYSTERLISDDFGVLNCEQIHTRMADDSPHPLAQRIFAIDTFRGICLASIIFVDAGGGGYWFFRYSPWDGLTFADAILPWFIFILGICIALSFYKRRYIVNSRLPHWSGIVQILRRFIIIFLLGLFLNNGINLSQWRLPGHLQRVAATYLVVSLSFICLASPASSYNESRQRSIREVASIWKVWLLMLGILILYLSLFFALPVPGCPRGYNGPGGYSSNGKYFNCTGGATGYIDRIIFGERHIDSNPSCKTLYHTSLPFDASGCLGTLTSIFTCFLGLQAGLTITTFNQGHTERFKRWALWGILWVSVGVGLSSGIKSTGLIPLNRNLWSLSYIILLSGLAYFALIVLYFIIDVKNWWNGSPFIYGGFNSILLYCGHIILHYYFPFFWYARKTHAERLLRDLVGTAIWFTIAYCMYYKKIFVTVR